MKQGMVAHICDQSTWEVEDHLKVTDYMGPYFKKNKTNI